MEGMTGKLQPGSLFPVQFTRHQIEVEGLVTPVKLVPHDRMPHMRQMDADLMLSPRFWRNPQQRILPPIPVPAQQSFPLRSGRGTVRPNTILDRDDAERIGSEWFVDDAVRCLNMAVDDGEVVFHDTGSFPEFAEVSGGGCGFCRHDNSAGFAVQAVDEVDFCLRTEVEPDSSGKAGPGVGFCGVTDQVSRFVENQNFGGLEKDLEPWIQNRGGVPLKRQFRDGACHQRDIAYHSRR